ncbi:hypothetical protein GJ744_009462, partial [Endocarpon pusillum]
SQKEQKQNEQNEQNEQNKQMSRMSRIYTPPQKKQQSTTATAIGPADIRKGLSSDFGMAEAVAGVMSITFVVEEAFSVNVIVVGAVEGTVIDVPVVVMIGAKRSVDDGLLTAVLEVTTWLEELSSIVALEELSSIVALEDSAGLDWGLSVDEGELSLAYDWLASTAKELSSRRITSTGGGDNLQNEWMSKLMGKKLTDAASDPSSFSKKELPSNHRVVEGESMMSMDHKPDRLNVHVDQDGIVKDVKMG